MSTEPVPPRPNIDGRIEALTMNVELLTQMHQDNEKRFTRMFEQHDQTLEKLAGIATRLTNIAENHEHRIRDLESGQQ